MKKNSVLLSEIKSFKGNVLGIGDIDKKIVEALNKNKSVLELNILSNNEYNIGSQNEKGKIKKLSIKRIRKLKHKRVNYLVVDYNNIDEYLSSFIKDSIYITKDYIYFITNDKNIKKYYDRYNTKIKEIKCSDESIYVIDVSKAKNNIFKEFIYNIIDSFKKLIDIITNLLLS